jgi:eukaryotic-like serine/threonine-protein kinase
MNSPSSPNDSHPESAVRFIGRYALHGELASGGMAAVHLGRLLGEVGFTRTVAIKCLHSQHARDPEFVAMFLDEARLVSRIKHPNVVPTLDVVRLEGEIFLVMEYIHGAPVSVIMKALSRRKERMPPNIAVGITLGLLEGLHAAHEATNEDGTSLEIVHRDVSPQNVMVGADGIPRVLDFGIAKASVRLQTTEDGSFKGKLGYMPPDVLSGAKVDRRADLWGAAVVLWEMLVGKRLFHSNESPHALVRMIVDEPVDPPSKRGAAGVTPELEAVLLKALSKPIEDRYQNAREMVSAIEEAMAPASSRLIGEWVQKIVGEDLDKRAAYVAEMERATQAHRPSLGTVRGIAGGGGGSSGVNPTVTGPIHPSHLPPPPPLMHNNITGPIHPSQLPSFPPDAMTATPAVIRIEDPASKRGRVGLIALVLVLLAVVAVLIPVSILGVRAMQKPIPTTVVATTAPTPTESTTTTTTTTASTTAAPLSPSVAASHSAPASTRLLPAKQPPQPPRVNCNPPYTIGPPPDYIKKPKLECLPR